MPDGVHHNVSDEGATANDQPTQAPSSSDHNHIPFKNHVSRYGGERSRLVNKPLSRREVLRAAARDYCTMLYEAAVDDCEFHTRRRRKEIHIHIRNIISGEMKVCVLKKGKAYGDLYREVRQLFDKPTHATTVSMRLSTTTGWIIDCRSTSILDYAHDNQELLC